MRTLIVTLLGLGLAGCQKTDTTTPTDATPGLAAAPAPADDGSTPPYLDEDERAARRAAPAEDVYEEEVSDEDDYDDDVDDADADASYDDYEDEDPDESYVSDEPYRS